MKNDGWRKSTRSQYNQNCVEVRGANGIQVRDSKDKRPEAPILAFGRGAWDGFVAGLKA